ncbi:very short patch repair endonuclease [Nocardia macrotermitis]|uniref:very short patch repair endonuclease n=1 Tax=Nocardia macrotermitis TaxID=2585198 RepID=UPI001D129527|nr:very short patch repair endonuclease [Nocardia macrotermitis]
MAMKETPEQRSHTMRSVRSQDTGPEMAVRRYLHAAGLRYRLHDRSLPGKPDIVFPSRRVIVFVHGCFWHQHLGCPASARPASNTEYWTRKLDRNIERDIRNRSELEAHGWSVFTVWECQIRHEDTLSQLVDCISSHSSANSKGAQYS